MKSGIGKSRVLLALLVCSCSRIESSPNEIQSFSGRTMGTTYSVRFHDLPPTADIVAIHEKTQTLLDQLDHAMSTYRGYSEICRFASHRGTNWFDVSTATARVVAESLRISEICDGSFDVTIDPLVRLWGFGPTQKKDQVSSEIDIAAAMRHVDYRKLHVRLDPPAIRKEDPEISIDLSAIAKGYAADAVAELLEKIEITNYLIAIAGENRARGTWKIGIEKPSDDSRQILQGITVTDCAISTSGDYRNFFVAGGHRYSHEIDPRTGRPVSNNVASVTVIAPAGAMADAMATALMVIGPESGIAIAKNSHIACLFVIRKGDGFDKIATPDFDAMSRD